MGKLVKFISLIMAGAMALGIIVSLVVFSSVIASLCGIAAITVFAIVGIAFFITSWILLNSMFKNLDITFEDDEDDKHIIG